VDAALDALHVTEDAFGKDHIDTARTLFVAAQIINAAGRPAEAKPLAERALAIQARVNGELSVPVGEIHTDLGNIESHLHDRASARAHFEKAIAIAEHNKADGGGLAIPLAALALLDVHTQHLPEAIVLFRRALELFARTSGTETLDYVMTSANLASALETMHRCDEAEPIVAEVRASTAKFPVYYPELLLTIGRCGRLRSQAAAIDAFEQALALCVANRCPPAMTAMVRWELGSTLGDRTRDRRRGIDLVREARAAMFAIAPQDDLIATMDRWLRAHPP